MFAVIFEVLPKRDRWDDYLAIARLLRADLERIDGFLVNERYRSEQTPGRVLSLSFWRDEKALVRWRAHATHYAAGQTQGRREIFADYHLRVGEVVADSQPPAGSSPRPTRVDETEVGAAKAVAIVEAVSSSPPSPAMADGVLGWERFANLTEPSTRIVLLSLRDVGTAIAADATPGLRVRRVRIIREYGLRDRHEAPQYFPAPP